MGVFALWGQDMNGKYFVLGTAIIGITVIEGIALYTGHDGAMLSTCVAAIAAMGGLAAGKVYDVLKTKDNTYTEK